MRQLDAAQEDRLMRADRPSRRPEPVTPAVPTCTRCDTPAAGNARFWWCPECSTPVRA